MAKTYSAIKTISDQIKNATTAASNTAAIVGGNLGDIVDKIQEVDGAKVPTTTTVNGKPLSGNISLDATDIGIAPDLADKVSKTATETIGGTKTFSVSPIIPTPDADMEAATKKYVDDAKATVDAALLNKADLVGGKIPTSQLPAYVDDVLEYANLAAFPATGEAGKIYVALDTNLTYRWSGSAYVEISKSLALGETSSTAYRGDRGKTAYDHSQATGNVHGTTASQIPNTPAGTIAATTVQGAINELAGDIVQVETDLNLDEYTIAEALNLLYSKIISLETIIANGIFKNLQVDNLTTVNAFNYNGAPLIVIGSTAPTSAPDFVGQTYINTTAPGTVYSAKGASSVSDWKQTSN